VVFANAKELGEERTTPGMCCLKTTLALAATFVALVDCTLPLPNGRSSAGRLDGQSPSLCFGHLSQAFGTGNIAKNLVKSSATCRQANTPPGIQGFRTLASRNCLGRLCCRGDELVDRSHTSNVAGMNDTI
jgi:hypothetical protein